MTSTLSSLSKKHLLGIKGLSKDELFAILDRADHWARINENPNEEYKFLPVSSPLKSSVICNLFFEPSTRTRFSFEVAAKKLGSHVLNFNPSSSSTQKGETLYDTIKTLEAMGTNVAIIRHPDGHILQEIAPKFDDLAIINAGDGTHEHPTQCLLDLQTIRQEFGHIEGLKVAIIGDIEHSRVARSNMYALDTLGAEVLFSGPERFLLNKSELTANARIVSVDEAVSSADVVMMLRVQLERHASRYHDLANGYLEEYGLSKRRFDLMQPHAKIMHPAPFNRDVEIDGSLVEGNRSLIYKQVANGVASRMAILERAVKS